ncbi:MAG TPA: methyltransferase domain-containing protein [Rhizomicrobium sp.]|nr:methyltransferase domain-containing protein [Rhizomicrobium sp.]
MTWDPKIYLAFGGERTRAAAELLARIDCDDPRTVADLGCGPGNSTALLAARWPEAAIDGIDNSPAMLREAREANVRARWIEADVEQWAADAPYNVIYANATLHWLPAHATLLPRLLSDVTSGGVLAFQVPRNFREPSHAIMQALATDPRWSARLNGVGDWWNVLEPEQYYAILEPHCASVDIWETRYLQRLEGEDAVYRWVLGTGLRPYAEALEGADREEFLKEYRARVACAYPRRASGVTLFPFQRLFCVAKKSA